MRRFLALPVRLAAMVLFPLIAGIALILNDLVYYLLVAWWRRPADSAEMAPGAAAQRGVSVVVLSWEGRDLLERYLPSVVRAVGNVKDRPAEVVVVDNGSTDGTSEMLKRDFPGVRVVRLETNEFFTGGNNAGARAARYSVIVFLNNDMEVAEDFLAPLCEAFDRRPSLFAASCEIFFEDTTKRREETGKTRGWWTRGWSFFAHSFVTDDDRASGLTPTFWMGGGSSGVDRAKFLEVGGFDDLYDPFYLEDTSISYQAWKRGWDVMCCPASKVWHRHRGTNNPKWGANFVERVIRKNQFLYIWRNVTSPRKTLAHVFWLPLSVARLFRDRGTMEGLRSLRWAARQIPAALVRRNRDRVYSVRTDEDLYRVANSAFELREEKSCAGDGAEQRRPDEPLRLLFLCGYLPALGVHAGAGRIFNLIRRLAKTNRVSVLSFIESEDERRFVPALEAFCECVRVIPRNQGECISDPLGLFPGMFIHDFGKVDMRRELESMLGNRAFDILQCEYIMPSAIVPDTRRTRTVLTEHEVLFAAMEGRMRNGNGRRSMADTLRWLRVLQAEVSLCRKFDKVVTVTDADRKSLLAAEPTLPVEVVNTGVDLDYFKPSDTPPSPEPSIVFVGYYRHDPNVDAMTWFADEIFPRILDRQPAASMWIVGSHPSDSIRALGQRPGIRVTGWVEDIRPYISNAWVYVVPIRQGVGIRGKILEAWAMERAVVSTCLGALGIDANLGRNILVEDEAATFADAVCRVIEDEALRKTLAQGGLDTVRASYGWDALALVHEKLYRRLLSEDARS